VIGVRRKAAGRGLGGALLDRVDEWARKTGVTRLELTVMAHNERALRLYTRQGYEIEGRRRNSLRVGGDYVDELALAKLLD
jgi:RimJ/RimL family protein N-acetyltransferase